MSVTSALRLSAGNRQPQLWHSDTLLVYKGNYFFWFFVKKPKKCYLQTKFYANIYAKTQYFSARHLSGPQQSMIRKLLYQ